MNKGKTNILLVEDNPGDAELIEENLLDQENFPFALQHSVSLAGSFEIDEESIDVILLDLDLPDSSGLQTLIDVRSFFPSLPIVVLTGNTDDDVALGALEKGAQDYLVKGRIQHDQLKRVIRYSMQRVELENQMRDINENLEKLVEERTQDLENIQREMIKKEKLIAIGSLSGSVAHDIRNPLGAISNSIYFLGKYFEQSSDQLLTKHIRIMDVEIQRVNEIISELLEFSRMQKPELMSYDIHKLIQQAIGNLDLPEKITLITEFVPSPPPVLLNPSQMRRALSNLMINAIQAMADGGTLRVKTHLEGQYLQVNISDTGNGIDPGNIDQIFDPLYTDKAKGVGLGLAIVKNFVEKHDGYIAVNSNKGQGSEFTIQLPIPT